MSRLVVGTGPVLVLLHGVGLDHTMWLPLAGCLSGERTVVAYDLLGHGDAAPLDDPATLEQFTAQLWRVGDELGLSEFDLCGFSMGAMIAQAAAMERPDRIRRLILMSGVHRRSDAERAGVRGRLNQARATGSKSNIEAALERWFTVEFRSARPDVVSEIRRRLETNNEAEFLKAYAMFAEADAALADQAARIPHRTLVLTGEHDVGSTPAMMHAMAGELPNATTHLLEGLAHMAPAEDPAGVASVLDRFLSNDE